MTDKEKRILKEGVISIFGKFNICDHTATIGGLKNDILSFIDSMQEEPVSKNLEEAAVDYAATDEVLPNGKVMIDFQAEKAFKAGANWQKEQMTAKAGNGRVDSVSNRQTRAHITVAFDSPRDIEVLHRLKVIVIKED